VVSLRGVGGLELFAAIAGVSAFGSFGERQEKVALIIVDTQLCFTNGSPDTDPDNPFAICNPPATGGSDTCDRYGSLGVASGQSIVPTINELRGMCDWDLVVRSQDYHPANHFSFGSRHFGTPTFTYEGGPVPAVGYPINMHCTVATSGMLDDAHCCLVDTQQDACTALDGGCTQDTDPTNPACAACAADPSSCTVMPMNMWTDHCEQSGDSGFATGLEVPDTDIVLQKGVQPNIDAYSIFMDNAKLHKTPLDDILKAEGITTLVVVGIAYDFCVSWTAQDGADLGYEVYVVSDASAPIALDNGDGTTTVDGAIADMTGKGVEIITMAQAYEWGCPTRRRLEEQGRRVEEQPKGRKYTLW